jgi:hypothetical protein
MNTLTAILADAATLTFKPRPDYGPDVEAAHSHTLASRVGWECPSDICQGTADPSPWDVEADNGEYRGWAKWERIERNLFTHHVNVAVVECGHCGLTTDLLTGDLS